MPARKRTKARVRSVSSTVAGHKRRAGWRFAIGVATLIVAAAVVGVRHWARSTGATGRADGVWADAERAATGKLSATPSRRSAALPVARPEAASSGAPTRDPSLVQWKGPSADPGGAIATLARKQDVQADNWESEVQSEAATQQLNRLRAILNTNAPIEPRSLASLIADDFRCSGLVPATHPVPSAVDVLRLQRAHEPATDEGTAGEVAPPAGTQYTGSDGFARALNELLADLGCDQHSIYFKLYRIRNHPGGFSTRVRYEAGGRNAEGSRQQSATWNCVWQVGATQSGAAPRLQSIAVAAFETAAVDLPGGHLFQDCTASILQANPSYVEQVLPGIGDWLTRVPREFMGQFGHHGLAVGDVNQDGLDDLYVCDAGGLPNRLYLQQPDGSATDIAATAGVDFLDDSTSALLVDFDNDGDQDLVVATDPVLQFAENVGQGRFRLRSPIQVNTDTFSLSAADFDRDGDVDLYVCGYNVRKQDPTHRDLPFPLPYHDANNGGRNLLLRNEGQLRFVDVTGEVGLDVNNSRFSMAAAWDDFDNDGDVDLYVANDFGRNNLYRNDNGHFHDIAAEAGVEDQASGMSVSWGDVDRDGRMDLYVSNMFSAAGNRITYQPRFASGVPRATVTDLQRMARGNTLFLNRTTASRPVFDDISQSAGVTWGRWAWASKFVDLMNRGWPDLVVTNGYITNENTDDL